MVTRGQNQNRFISVLVHLLPAPALLDLLHLEPFLVSSSFISIKIWVKIDFVKGQDLVLATARLVTQDHAMQAQQDPDPRGDHYHIFLRLLSGIGVLKLF